MTIDDKRWKQLNTLLTEALEQPVEERDAWVTVKCVDDPALAGELRELLTYDVKETGGLAASIAKTSATRHSFGHWHNDWQLSHHRGDC